MTLRNAILFPQAMLPLFIFEPRYRKMLADCLLGERMFCVALQKPGRSREVPSNVAGLGLVRACVNNKDGTSHVILQGLARVQLGQITQHKPYRVQEIKPMRTTGAGTLVVDALTAKILDLVADRLGESSDIPVHVVQEKKKGPVLSPKDGSSSKLPLEAVIKYLSHFEDPEQLADLISCTLLQAPSERQKILETPNLEARLKHLIHFLMDQSPASGDTATS